MTTMRSEAIQILDGATPNVLDRIVAMHARYYARALGMGAVFERKVTEGLAEFLPRLMDAQNRLWLVIADSRIVGSLAIDWQGLGDGLAHLRWFILDEECRGLGIGSSLLPRAIDFVDGASHDRTVLWTFRGLNAARHLYEREGFCMTQEYAGEQWGVSRAEQRFERNRSAVQATVTGLPA